MNPRAVKTFRLKDVSFRFYFKLFDEFDVKFFEFLKFKDIHFLLLLKKRLIL